MSAQPATESAALCRRGFAPPWFVRAFARDLKRVLQGNEASSAVVFTLDDVDGRSSALKAGLAWHDGNYAAELHALSMGSVPICQILGEVGMRSFGA
jgi:hypothetical protein